jgi:hypothetical protein
LFERQIRESAALRSTAVAHEPATRPVINIRQHASAPLIGAVVGAVALPASLYLLTHDRDSGPWGGGALLLTGAIGAFLGLMIGLAIRG